MAEPQGRRAVWTLVALSVVLALPESLHLEWAPWRALTLSGELLALVLVARRLPPRVGPWLVSIGWTTLMAYELVRLGSIYLSSDEPLLYDVAWLARHVVVLVTDLWGFWGGLGLLAAAVAVVGTLLGVRRLARRVLASEPNNGVLVGLFGLSLVGLLTVGPWPGRWTAPRLVESLVASHHVFAAVRSGVQSDAYADHAGLALTRRPDVELYVVESYGRLLELEPDVEQPWRQALANLEIDLSDRGWHIVSGFARAPVSGGRSWVSDGSVFLGMGIAHESVWQHVRTKTDELPHLPGFLTDQGYATVVVRPKDRERPGVRHRNDFGWQHTIFYDELGWTGPKWGWGWIPDQYSLGRLHDDLLPAIPSPRLVFFHGVSAHGPWTSVPPLADDWRDLPSMPGPDMVPAEISGSDRQFKRDLKLYRREAKKWTLGDWRLQRWADDYLASVLYSLTVSADAIGAAPVSDHPGRIVILYGDHQPPLMAQGRSADVPVHVVASDPALLEAFIEVGFTAGMQPTGDTQLRLEGLYPTIVRSLALADGQVTAPRPEGLDITPALSQRRAP